MRTNPFLKIVQIIYSIIVWSFMIISCFPLFIVDFIIWLLTFWWDKRTWVLHRYSIFWALIYVWLNPLWKINIKGGENIKKKKTYVIISNHQSAMDIVVLYRLLTHFKWIAKRELFKVPFVGWNLRLNKHVPIDRNSPKSALEMMQKAVNHLNQGSSILIFPEGTRSEDGVIKRFKDGAFIIAKRAEVAILPVVINGTLETLPKSGMVGGRQTFVIHVLPEIPYDSFKDKSLADISKEMHQLLTEEHKKIAPKYYS
ncbi:MAG: 1-acyl-sn-glycerol-3-phosphate acyltransferase [Bacteroidales bacterium]|nr:1-acyl-sn-glycerol-3-phosphate acyltransferase [Bacteroidales bacterium]